jgi:hypothetical protein
MARIYRDIGLAAVANELALPTDDFDPDLSEAVKRGARYVYLMPKSERSPTPDRAGAARATRPAIS